MRETDLICYSMLFISYERNLQVHDLMSGDVYIFRSCVPSKPLSPLLEAPKISLSPGLL